MQVFKNPFETAGEWYKANLHTHTTTSDGELPLPERIAQYKDQGYQILAITDHRKTNDLSGFSSDGFLAISGMETHPMDPSDTWCYHFVCLNVPLGFDLDDIAGPNERIRKVKEVGGEVFIGHPYWCGHNLQDLMPIEGAIGVEVYNATCTKVGKGFSSVHWDDMLAAGKMLPAFAVDDCHRGRDTFMGWTMVKARSLTIESVMDALRSGCFYSSCGPTIEDARIVDGKVSVICSPACEIHFIGPNMHGRSVYGDGGLLTSAELTLNEHMRYVRVEVVDSLGNRAWTNPMVP